MTPSEIEATYPSDVVDAWHWVKTYAPHRATQQGDQQTYDTLNDKAKEQLDAMLAILRPYGLVLESLFQPKLKPGMQERRPNFIVCPLIPEARMETQNEWLSSENRRLTAQVEQLLRDLHTMDGQRERAIQQANSMAAEQDVVLGCDACGLIIDEPQHYSGMLNGVESGHIHLCQMCSAKLPWISVTTGGKPFVLEN